MALVREKLDLVRQAIEKPDVAPGVGHLEQKAPL